MFRCWHAVLARGFGPRAKYMLKKYMFCLMDSLVSCLLVTKFVQIVSKPFIHF